MSVPTSRLALKLFGTGLANDVQPDETADISGINDNFRKLDLAVGWYVCTSTTRPASPYSGQAIYETNTKRGYVFDGAAFQLIFDGNFTSGLRGTTTQRDAYWGAPTTGATAGEQATRVALASKGPLWFNTDNGWEEQYFAKVADAGALAGNVALNPGWYPSGRGAKPMQGLEMATAGYGVGTTVITTQPNAVTIAKSGIGFVDPKLDGTAPGVRMIVPIEGNYRLTAYGNFNSSTINLMLKKNSVSGDATGVVAGDSGNGVNSNNFRGFSSVVPLAVGDFLILAWYASTAGSGADVRWSIAWDSVRSV